MKRAALFIAFAAAIIFVAAYPSQAQFAWIMIAMSLAFGSFSLLIRESIRTESIFSFIALGVILRISLLFFFPNLSDDIYRFCWDGQLLHLGINPFTHLPSTLEYDDAFLQQLYPSLNSESYFSIYPPLNQWSFYLATYVPNVKIAAGLLKCILCLCELASVYFILSLLKTFKLPSHYSLLYWLNPLVIVELIGNVHFEAMMVCFVLGMFWLLSQNKYTLAGIAYAMAISSKLLPLMFGPLLLKYLWSNKKFFGFFAMAALIIVVLLYPFIGSTDLLNWMSSVDLYFRKFEFNASVYYFFRAIGNWLVGYNIIQYLGPALSFITLMMILKWSWSWIQIKLHTLIHLCLLSFILYLLMTTTVHPWYLVLPLSLNVFFRYKFILLWSFLIYLSYNTYQWQPFREDLSYVILEYSLIALCFWFFDLNQFKSNLSRATIAS